MEKKNSERKASMFYRTEIALFGLNQKCWSALRRNNTSIETILLSNISCAKM